MLFGAGLAVDAWPAFFGIPALVRCQSAQLHQVM